MIVIDASAALSSVLDNQSTQASRSFFSKAESWTAPVFFGFEVYNSLLKLERRGVLTARDVDSAVLNLSVVVDHQAAITSLADYLRLIALSRQEKLSLFDAAYLDLAIEEKAALASRDASLLAAAQRQGVPIHDLR